MRYLAFIILYIPLFFIGQNTLAQYNPEKGIIVELSDGFGYNDLTLGKRNWKNDFKIKRKLSQEREIYLFEVDENRRDLVMLKLAENPMFKEVVPDEWTKTRQTPNDPGFVNQRNFKRIDVASVWKYTTGGKTIDNDDIVVAVMDDGFFINEEDMVDNHFINSVEKPGDSNGDGCPGDCGVDDDGDGLIDEDNMGRIPGQPGYNTTFMSDDDENGYKDDIQGLRLGTGTDNHIVLDHGTSVASIIGAKGNNGIGVTGINWNSNILMLSEGVTNANVIEGYSYMISMRKMYNKTNGEKGAFIVASNYSLGIDGAPASDYPLWCSLYDDLGEAGIISCVATTNDINNVEVVGDMPSGCTSKYMFAVTSTDQDEMIQGGYGNKSIDVAAPGHFAFTLVPIQKPKYGIFGGTSSASPHLAGVIALMYSIQCENFIKKYKNNPELVNELGERIINAGDEFTTLKDKIRTGKRLNAYKALLEINKDCTNSPVTLGDLDLVVYPSPTLNEVKIVFNTDPKRNTYLYIYNILGQKMHEEKIEKKLFELNEITINIGDYPASVYYVTLKQGNRKRTYPILKL